ncbi:hypothetical protein ACJIZ3_017584 [Penstemon smallii]|uniref:Oberon PHD finger domain-containing protein n=1 Tax=Penstemon smallii TaxID=265156 RepID=A0ABD3SVY5_9LAMI
MMILSNYAEHKMACEPQESMDIDSSGGSKGTTSNGVKGNGFNLYPVSINDSGEGLPYAPEDWPNKGDKWGWKVGKRTAASGHFLDRYMHLPTRLHKAGQVKSFASRLSLENYIRSKFPETNVDTFFSSFSWKIPSTRLKKDEKEIFNHSGNIPEHQVSFVQIDGVQCKAGNRACNSLDADKNSTSEVIFCDICCNEPGFCRDCCCILCSRTISNDYGGYSYIRCEANIEGLICGHNCHIECALRAYMAGTVGGSIGLDAEYYCRRCDSTTDLISHVSKLLQNCESIESRDDIVKALKVGFCVLRGSKRKSAKQLLRQIELVMSKLKNGTYLEDIWKKEVDTSTVASGLSPIANGALELEDSEMGSSPALSSKFDLGVESLKLEDKIVQILHELRKSQEIEYRLAEETLSSQKNYMLDLYQKLDEEKSDLLRNASSKDHNSLLDVVADQIKQEVTRLKDMEEVSKGFGRVPKHILKEQFGIE